MIGLEQLQEHQVGLARVLYIVAETLLHIADITRAEVRGLRLRTRIEHGHAGFALDVVLPFVCVRVPVQFPHAARFDRDQCCGDRLGHEEVAAVGNLHHAALGLFGGCQIAQREDERMPRRARGRLYGALRGRQRARVLSLEDPQILERDVLERVGRYAETRRENIRRRVRQPVGEHQGVEFGGPPVIEREHEFGTVRPQSLQRVGQAGREIPQVAGLHVGHLGAAQFVQYRNPTVAVRHDGPLGLLVPVQFADAVRPQAHIDARNIFRDGKIGLGDFARPAAALIAFVRIVEGRPKQWHSVDVGGGRILKRRELARERRILRTRFAQGGRALRIDSAFRGSVRVAERGCARGAHAERGCRCRCADQEIASHLISHLVVLFRRSSIHLRWERA